MSFFVKQLCGALRQAAGRPFEVPLADGCAKRSGRAGGVE